jgi:hypothetical protein
MRTKPHKHGCHCGDQDECGYIAVERNRYFTGKYMAARDFQDEQTYFLSRHRLHNRLLHGWGIVCGLKVTHHPNPDCASRWVIVHPGIAIDCCGRELIVECETSFEIPFEEFEQDAGDEQSTSQEVEQRGSYANQEQQTNNFGEFHYERLLLALHYVEEEIERVPALFNESGCDRTRTEANRVREKAELIIVRFEDVEGDCWRDPRGHPGVPCRDDCGDELPGPSGSCLKPNCPCGELVPLALLTYEPDHPERGLKIGKRGRRQLPPPPEFLTHIVDINWPHGGEVTLSQLNDDMGGRLEIGFDRRIMAANAEATGVNEFTFVVQYGGAQRAVEFLPFPGDEPPSLVEDCRAVFTIDPNYISSRGR